MVAPGYIPQQGDLIWLDFDPRVGHEQGGHRPALVLSPASYNGPVGLALVCPITSQVKGYPFEVEVVDSQIEGVILADQVINVAWRERGARLIAKAGPHTHAAVLENLSTLLD